MRPYFKDTGSGRTTRRGRANTGHLKSSVVTLSVVALFIGFAGLITLLAPTYLLVLRRSDAGVQARIEQRLLWWVPIRVQTVEAVTGVKSATEQPERGDPRPGQSRADVSPAEMVGYVILVGAGGEIRTMVSPENLADVRREIESFLGERDPELRVRTVANWKAAVIAPGIVAALGGLLLLLYLWDVVRWIAGKKE